MITFADTARAATVAVLIGSLAPVAPLRAQSQESAA